jgi:uncharacterized repeat protein (TIGR01451 family)
MTTFRWIIASTFLGLFSTVLADQSGNITVSHYEPLQRLQIRAADVPFSQKFGGSSPVVLGFDALGQSFEFQLEPNIGLLSAASRAALPEGIGVFRGHLAGNTESWARIVMLNGVPRGLFWDGNEMYAIEAPGDSIVKTDSPIIYRLSDTYIVPGSMTCGSASFSGNGATVFGKLVGELNVVVAQGPGAVSEISIGAVSDFEFTTAKGGGTAAAAEIVTRINMVDGIFSQEIGVKINVPFIDAYDIAADPFTDESDASLLIDEVKTYRENTPAQNSLGLTHLYTGRVLDGNTVGIAFQDVLCRTDAGAGLSEGTNNATFDSLVAAHEIGHNFGAPHDGVTGACEAEPMSFIMAPTLNGSTEFSPCTIAIMQANAAQASCVSALPTVDMSVALSGQAATVLLGTSPELTIDLNNNGASDATNVVADITLPGNVTLVSVTPSAGTCTTGAGTVNCIMGDVPGVSGRSVSLITTASSVGVGSFDVIVSSDFDERPGNNQSSAQLTIDPAVDLVINSPSSATIDINQSTSVSATLDNLSILDATGVTLSILLPTGLQADSASWSIGTCTVTSQQVDCQAAIFANQSSATLSLGVTGLTAGNRRYTVTLSSTEADADTVNNSLEGTVRVNDPDDEGGGGAAGLVFIWMIGFALFLARRRAVLCS